MNKRRNISNDCEQGEGAECDNCFTYGDCSVQEPHLLHNNNNMNIQNHDKYNHKEGVENCKNVVDGNSSSECNNYSQVCDNNNAASRINSLENETQCKVNCIGNNNDNNNTKDDNINNDKRKYQHHEQEMETLLYEFVKVKEHVSRLISEMQAHLSVLQKSTLSTSSSSLLWNQTSINDSHSIWENASNETPKVNPFVVELHDELLKRHEAALLMLQTCANCINVCENKTREKAEQMQCVKEEQVELHNTKQAMTRYILGQRKREEEIKTEATKAIQREHNKYEQLMENAATAFSSHHQQHVFLHALHRWLKQTMIRCYSTQHQLQEQSFVQGKMEMSTHVALKWHERRTMEGVWRYWCLQRSRRQCHRYREAVNELSHALQHVEQQYRTKCTELEKINEDLQERLRAREKSTEASIAQLEQEKEKLQKELNEMTHEFSTRTHTYVTEQDSVQVYFTSREAALENKLIELAHANQTLENNATRNNIQMSHLLQSMEHYYQDVLMHMIDEHTVHQNNEFTNALDSVWHRWHEEFVQVSTRERKLSKDVATLAPLSGKVLHLQNELSAAEHAVHVAATQNTVLSSQLEHYRSLHFAQEESHATLTNDLLRRRSYYHWLHYSKTKKINSQSIHIAQLTKTLEEKENDLTNKYRSTVNAHNAKMQELTDELRRMERTHKTLLDEQKAELTEQLLEREMQLSNVQLQLEEAHTTNEELVEHDKATKEEFHKCQRECCELTERSSRAVNIMSEEHKWAALLNSHYTQWQSKCQEVESQLSELTLVCKQWEEYCGEQQTKFDLEREALTAQLTSNVNNESKSSYLLQCYYYKWLLHCVQIHHHKEQQREMECNNKKSVHNICNQVQEIKEEVEEPKQSNIYSSITEHQQHDNAILMTSESLQEQQKQLFALTKQQEELQEQLETERHAVDVQLKRQEEAFQLELREMETMHRQTLYTMEIKFKDKLEQLTAQQQNEISTLKREQEWHLLTLTETHNTETEKLQRTCQSLQEHTNELAESVVEYCAKTTFVQWQRWTERRKARKREGVIRKYVQWLHGSVRVREEYDITHKHNLLMEYIDKMMNNNNNHEHFEEKCSHIGGCGSNMTNSHESELSKDSTIYKQANVIDNNCDRLEYTNTNTIVSQIEQQTHRDLDNKECIDNTMMTLFEETLLTKLETYLETVQVVVGAKTVNSSSDNVTNIVDDTTNINTSLLQSKDATIKAITNNGTSANNYKDINTTGMENSKVNMISQEGNNTSSNVEINLVSPCTSDVSVTVSSPASNDNNNNDNNLEEDNKKTNTVVNSVDQHELYETVMLFLPSILHENLTALEESLLHNISQLQHYTTSPLSKQIYCYDKNSDGGVNNNNKNSNESKLCSDVQEVTNDNTSSSAANKINRNNILHIMFDAHKWSKEITHATQLYLCIINNCVKELVQQLRYAHIATTNTGNLENNTITTNVNDSVYTSRSEEHKMPSINDVNSSSNNVESGKWTSHIHNTDGNSVVNDDSIKHKTLEMTVQSLLSELAMYVNQLQHILHNNADSKCDNKELQDLEKTECVLHVSNADVEQRSLENEFSNVADQTTSKTHTDTLHKECQQLEEKQSHNTLQEHEEKEEKQELRRERYKEESPRCEAIDDNGGSDVLMLLVEDNIIDHSVNTNTTYEENLMNVRTTTHTRSHFNHKTDNFVNDENNTNNVEVEITNDTPTKTELRHYISHLEQLLVEAKVQLAYAKSHADTLTYKHNHNKININSSSSNNNKRQEYNIVHTDSSSCDSDQHECNNVNDDDVHENVHHKMNTSNLNDNNVMCSTDADHIIHYPSQCKINMQTIAHSLPPCSLPSPSSALNVPLSVWQSEHVLSSSSSLPPLELVDRSKCSCHNDINKEEIENTAAKTLYMETQERKQCSTTSLYLTPEQEESKLQPQETNQEEQKEERSEVSWHELNALMSTLQHYKTMSTQDKNKLLQSCKEELNAAVSVMRAKYEEKLRVAYNEIQSLLHTIDVNNEQYAHEKDEWVSETHQQLQKQQKEQEEHQKLMVVEHHKSMEAMKANYEDEITSLHDLVNEMRGTSQTQSYLYEEEILRKREEYNRMELTSDEQLRWQLMWIAHVSLMQQYEKEAKLKEENVQELTDNNAAHNAKLAEVTHKCNEELESKDDYIISLSELFAMAQKWQSSAWRHRENNLWSKVEIYFTCATNALKNTLSHYVDSINDLESRYGALVNEMQSVHTEEKDALETELMHLQERIAASNEITNNAKEKEEKLLSHNEELEAEQRKTEQNKRNEGNDDKIISDVVHATEDYNNKNTHLSHKNSHVTIDNFVKANNAQDMTKAVNTTHLTPAQTTESHRNKHESNIDNGELDDNNGNEKNKVVAKTNNKDDMQSTNVNKDQQCEQELKEDVEQSYHANGASDSAKEKHKEELQYKKEQDDKSQYHTNSSDTMTVRPQILDAKESCNASLFSLEPLELSQRLVHFTISLSKQREMADAVVSSTDALSDKLQALITQGAKLRSMIEQHVESLKEQHQQQKQHKEEYEENNIK